MLDRQPDGLPPPGSWTRVDRAPTAAERAAWAKESRRELAFVVGSCLVAVAVFGASVAGIGAAAWLLITDRAPPRWFVVACAALPAPLLLWRGLRGVVWRVRSPHADRSRVVELQLDDARAWHVDDGDKLHGYLFVLDERQSFFLHRELPWAPTSGAERGDDADAWAAPARLRVVLGVAGDGRCTELARDDGAALRWIPNANEAAVAAVKLVTSGWAFDRVEGFLPTPEPLTRSR